MALWACGKRTKQRDIMKKEIVLIGAGGHCKSCIDVIEAGGMFEIKALVDTPAQKGKQILNYTINYTDADLPELAQKYKNFLITIGHMGNAQIRKNIFNTVKTLGGQLPVIISPLAYVSPHAKIEEGTIILHHALVNAGATVGKNCIINTKVLIEHDAKIGGNCHIATAAVINGSVNVGYDSFVGSNALTKQGAVIAPGSFVKAGSVAK